MKNYFLAVLYSLPLVVFCQKTAVLENGQKVLLKIDGTWEYLKEDDKKTGIKEDAFTFRRTFWGMTRTQVKESESAAFIRDSESASLNQETDLVAYSAKILSRDALIMYIFADNKLVRARYSFTDKYADQNEYIAQYQSINAALQDKYRNPKAETEHWVNETYKADPSKKGLAVSLGHLKYYTEWETGATSIISALTGENGKIQLVTEYASKQYHDLEKNKKKEKNKSIF